MGHIWQAAAALGVGCQVRLNLTGHPPAGKPAGGYRSVADRLLDDAVAAVPLPGGGRAPLDRLRDPAQDGTADAAPTSTAAPSTPAAAPQADRAAHPDRPPATAAAPLHRPGAAPGATRGPRR
jgi:hypothetical protein